MSIGLRGFVEFLVKKIEEEGLLGSGFTDSEREDDIIKTIWDVYHEWNGED